ncbi:MAG: thioesterase family protein [Alphaproteobacteria bacterium]|nr:thioesterase family protein [Alphaproteobacteria bacterium]
MNVQHHLARSSDASFTVKAALGLGQARRPETTFVALEHHIRFHREMRASELIQVRCGIAGHTEKRLRLVQELHEARSGDLATSFTAEVGHMHLRSRRLVPWTDEALHAIAKLQCPAPEPSKPRALTPETVLRNPSLAAADGQGLIMSGLSAINPWDCDSNGHLNAQFYMAAFSDAQGHFWSHIGIPRQEQSARGLGTATTEYRIAYLRELQAGELMLVRTGLVGYREKTVHFRHWVFEGETGAPCAIAEGIALLFDKETRRAVPIPADVRTGLPAKLAATI